MSKKHVLKSVESICYQMQVHYQKVVNERQKESPDENLIRYWEREIKGLEKSLPRAEKRLKRGK